MQKCPTHPATATRGEMDGGWGICFIIYLIQLESSLDVSAIIYLFSWSVNMYIDYALDFFRRAALPSVAKCFVAVVVVF